MGGKRQGKKNLHRCRRGYNLKRYGAMVSTWFLSFFSASAIHFVAQVAIQE
jgi:hypothetical protein